LLTCARVLDGVLQARFIDAPEHLLCAGKQIRRRLPPERHERTWVPLHGARLPFFEERQTKLVGYPTD
jgi:hypothetical protein